MQPSESSLYSFGFLKVILDMPPPLLIDSLFIVANASRVLFISSQVFAHVMASGVILVCAPELVEFDPPPLYPFLSSLILCCCGSEVMVQTLASCVEVPQSPPLSLNASLIFLMPFSLE